MKHIADETFAGCPKLVAVGLPDHLETIGVKAFYGSPRIRYIRCVNYGFDNNLVPPTFATFSGDPTDYGQAFSTEI